MSQSHTPILHMHDMEHAVICDQEGNAYADCNATRFTRDECRDHAAHIVKAVNEYEEWRRRALLAETTAADFADNNIRLTLINAELVEALKKYGHHSRPDHLCAFNIHSENKCDCGLDDALAKAGAL